MLKVFVAASMLVLCAGLVHAQDPVATNPEHYKVILENEQTRVLDYKDHPGEKTTLHRHPDSVLYALSNFTRRLTFEDGHSVEKKFKTGDVMFLPTQSHIGENIGLTDTHVILVELKEPLPMDASVDPDK